MLILPLFVILQLTLLFFLQGPEPYGQWRNTLIEFKNSMFNEHDEIAEAPRSNNSLSNSPLIDSDVTVTIINEVIESDFEIIKKIAFKHSKQLLNHLIELLIQNNYIIFLTVIVILLFIINRMKKGGSSRQSCPFCGYGDRQRKRLLFIPK